VPSAPLSDQPPHASHAAARPAWLRAAAWLVLVEAIAAFGAAVYFAVESVVAPTEAPEIGWGTAAFALICSGLIALVARGVARAQPHSRGPAVLVQLLLFLAIGVPLVQAGQYLVGVPVCAVAVAVVVLLFTAL
jgi:hypothetical protein